MRKIEIKGSEKSPKIVVDPKNGIIKILGRSSMNCPQEFYPTINKILQNYCDSPVEKTQLFLDLECYNTLSSRYILNILKLISRINVMEGKESKRFGIMKKKIVELKRILRSLVN